MSWFKQVIFFFVPSILYWTVSNWCYCKHFSSQYIVIRVPLSGGCPIVITLSVCSCVVRLCVTNLVWALDVGFDILHVGRTLKEMNIGLDLELWPHGQIPVFSMTNPCPGCNFFVFWNGLLIFSIWVDHLNQIHKYGLIAMAGPTEMNSCSMISSLPLLN